MKGLITEQPKQYPIDTMDLYKDCSKDHLLTGDSESCRRSCNHHQRFCERGATRRWGMSRWGLLFMIFGVLLVLIMGCAYYFHWDVNTLGGLVKRATEDPQGDNEVFIDKKYYLIIIFVGLALVVVLGIMLSAWCCRGVFENPLCCPCYVCACCGGLACLECIGCGLCAEAADL